MALRRITLREVRTGDDPTDRALDSLRTDLRPLEKSPSAVSRLVTVAGPGQQPLAMSGGAKVFVFGTSTQMLSLLPGGINIIPHSLGRPIEGRVVVYASAAGTLWDYDAGSANPSFDPNKYFGLGVSTAMTVKVLVF